MILSDDATGFQLGLALGVATILSIGPNNLLLMREGIARGRTRLVANLVLSSYVSLIMASVALSTLAVRVDPAMTTVLTVAGFLAISWFACQSLRAAMARRHLGDAGAGESAGSCVARVIRIVWLNPLTYLELLIVPAALCQSSIAADARIDFLVAFIVMAALCCYGYALGGHFIASVLQDSTNLRVFDFLSGIILSVVAILMATAFVAEVAQ